MSKKGFISIPILIAIIAGVVATVTVATGAVLYKQGKLAPLIASVSQTFKGTKDIEPEIKPEEPQPKEEQSLSEQISQEENSQTKQGLEQAKLEAEKAQAEAEKAKQEVEKAKAEMERLKVEQEAQKLAEERQGQEELRQQEEAAEKLAEEQQQQETEKQTNEHKRILGSTVASLYAHVEVLSEYIDNVTSIMKEQKNKTSGQIEKNKSAVNNFSTEFCKEKAKDLNGFYELDVKYMEATIGATYAIEQQTKIWKDFLNEWTIWLSETKEPVSNEDFVKYDNDIGVVRENLLEISKNLDETVKESKNFISESSEFYLDYFKDWDLQFRYLVNKSGYNSSDLNYNYQSVTDPIQDWLSNTYKQRQLETLQNINNNLGGILSELRY